MKNAAHYSYIVFFIPLVLGIITGDIIHGIMLDTRDPIKRWGRVEATNSPITAGSLLSVRVYRDKVRDDCPVTSIRSATNQDGQIFEIGDAIAAPGGAADSPHFDVAYKIPAHFPEGQYFLRVNLIYDCGRGGVFYHDLPAVPFRVEE